MTSPPAESDSITGDEQYRTLLEIFCASAQYAPDLMDEELVAQAADDLIDRVSYRATVADFHPVFVRAVTTGTLPPAALATAENHSETTILSFLRRLLDELERRRPWPEPPLVQVDPREWPALGGSTPIAWVDLPLPLVEEATRASFADAAGAALPDAEIPLLVLRLRTGDLVALVGERSHTPSRFVILLPGADARQDPAVVIEYLVRYTGLPLETAGIERYPDDANGPVMPGPRSGATR